MAHKAEVKFEVELGEDKIPETIIWHATDSGQENKPAEALMVSLWDSEEKSTFSVDLWTKKMMLNDMNIFFYQTLQKMADTYKNASNDQETSDKIMLFAQEFAREKGLIK